MEKKVCTIINLILIICLVGLIIAGWATCRDKVYNSYQQEQKQLLVPTKVTDFPDGTKSYTFNIQNVTHTTHSIVFYTNHQEVYVTVGGKLVYSCEKADSIFGHTTGSVWNRIETPSYSSQVVVYIRPVYDDVRSSETEFYFGDGLGMYEEMIDSCFIDMVICLLIMAIGFCVVMYFLLNKKSVKEIFYLGIFAFVLGFWSFGETTGAMLLIRSRVMASYTAFTCLMIVGIPFVLFVYNFLHLLNRRLCIIAISLIMIISIICQAMQFLNIRDIKQNDYLVHICILIACSYLFLGIIYNIVKRKHLRKVIISIVGSSILAISVVLDLRAYYDDRINANRYSKFGFLVFIVILCLESARYTKQQLEKERKLQFYQDMAVKDILTNCFNRNAYNEDIQGLDNTRNTYVITFDLNNLKLCNDTLGHNVGDQYLIDASTIIQNVFSCVGKVYRIGGDEFCVIAHKTSDERLYGLVEKMRKAEKDYNMDTQIKLAIACGIAKYNEAVDSGIEDTRARADELMYENKKELKKK